MRHGHCQKIFKGGVARKFSYNLQFKPFKNIFTGNPRVFKIDFFNIHINYYY